jgi:hypothetical protein
VDEPALIRCVRFPFHSYVELTDMQSNVQTWGRTSDLSLFGLRVDTRPLLGQGAMVKVRISHRGVQFEALGRVAYLGMGVVFSEIGLEAQRILDQWLAELSGR